jgi:hypothetical protein
MTEIIWDENDIPAPAKGARVPCENPFTWRPTTMKTTTKIVCKHCGKGVPTGTLELRKHLAFCRPEAAKAIEAEYGARERSAREVAAEGYLGVAA